MRPRSSMTGAAAAVFALSAALLAQTPAQQQTQTTMARAGIDTASPTACLTTLNAYVAKQQASATQAAPADANALLRQLAAERAAISKDCAARFDVDAAAGRDLASLATLATDGGDAAKAKAAMDRALPMTTLAPTDRAALLVTAVAVVRRAAPTTGGRDARQELTYPTLERIVEELDANPAATFDQKWNVHASMLGYYRGDDIDSGIIDHATWILDHAKDLPGFGQNAGHKSAAQLSEQQGFTLMEAHVDLAEAWAGEGMTDKALALLRDGKKRLGDLARADEMFDPEIARYSLVGKPAAAITAPTWINAPAGTTTMEMPGHVTLMEFTAHWCGPCRESYPGINRLRAEFESKGLRVVMVTRYWGYYSNNGVLERPLTPEVELQRDKSYFAEHQLDVPVAVGDQVTAKMVDGKVVYSPGPDPNDTHYSVTGIPQIQVIDKRGIIRRILVGYDNANEAGLAELISQLLDQK